MVNSLNETIELMTSSDYKDRFKAEYYQLECRIRKLEDMVKNWDKGLLCFTPTCERRWYTMQLYAMNEYLEILKMRAEKENIDL